MSQSLIKESAEHMHARSQLRRKTFLYKGHERGREGERKREREKEPNIDKSTISFCLLLSSHTHMEEIAQVEIDDDVVEEFVGM